MKITAKITNLNQDDNAAFKAYASVNLDDQFVMQGVRVMSGSRGLFAAMPNHSYTNDKGETKYRDNFYPITKEARAALNAAVLDAYDKAVEQAQSDVEIIEPDAEMEAAAETDVFVQSM